MTAGASPISSLLFFYTFFVVLLIFLLYGLWEAHQAQLQLLPNPLSAMLLGIPDSINLFEAVEVTLRVTNCGKTRLKKINAICGNPCTFALDPGACHDITLKLDTLYAGEHQLKARISCKQWEIHVFCSYRVFQRIFSKKEKYLRILGLKPGATREEIKKARNALAKRFHPDLEQGYEERMKEINEAYRKLMAS